MPLYVYVCGTCATRFERLRSFADRLEPSSCPECASEAEFALSLSAPSFVGSASRDSCHAGSSGPVSGCCGGGACGLN